MLTSNNSRAVTCTRSIDSGPPYGGRSPIRADRDASNKETCERLEGTAEALELSERRAGADVARAGEVEVATTVLAAAVEVDVAAAAALRATVVASDSAGVASCAMVVPCCGLSPSSSGKLREGLRKIEMCDEATRLP